MILFDLTILRPTLGHCREERLTHPISISASPFFYFRTESQQEPRNKVALLSPTERPEKRNLLDTRPRRRPLTKTKSYVQFNSNFKAFSENTKALSISDLRIQFFPLNKNFINITKRLSLKPHTTSNTMDIEQITSAFNNHVNVKKIREVFHEVS